MTPNRSYGTYPPQCWEPVNRSAANLRLDSFDRSARIERLSNEAPGAAQIQHIALLPVDIPVEPGQSSEQHAVPVDLIGREAIGQLNLNRQVIAHRADPLAGSDGGADRAPRRDTARTGRRSERQSGVPSGAAQAGNRW